jgi:PHD/YefM family antitoxin component YafN of YafNO toxin-antitoxin module
MSTASTLIKEKIVSLSELQKNPFKALNAKIVRIVKNGKEIGIFMTKEEFEDFIEEQLPLKSSFKAELKKAIKESKKGKKLLPLKTIL